MMFYQDNEVMSTVRIYTNVLSGTNSGISLMTEGHWVKYSKISLESIFL